jgi:hypothetical protein
MSAKGVGLISWQDPMMHKKSLSAHSCWMLCGKALALSVWTAIANTRRAVVRFRSSLFAF